MERCCAPPSSPSASAHRVAVAVVPGAFAEQLLKRLGHLSSRDCEQIYRSVYQPGAAPGSVGILAESSITLRTRKEEADYKYKYENGLLVKYGKELTGSDITGEYIGIGRFSKDFMPEFMEKLDGMIRTQQHSVWWENILYEMVGKRPVYVEEMDGLFWAEVDYVEDYERILRFRGYKADFSLNVEKI